MPRSPRLLHRFIFVFAVGLLGSSSVLAGEIDREKLIAQINSIAAEALADPGAVGLSISVAHGSEVIHADGYGLADLEHAVPMTSRSMLRIGSVTKQYTAALILKLAEDGELSLDDPITTYVQYPVGERDITIRHLLNHTSGIPSYTGIDDFWTTYVSRHLTNDELLAIVRKRPFDFESGERFLYNNTGYYMLGMVIEKVTGESYGDALRSHLLEPLELEATRDDVPAEIVPHRARGYTLSAGQTANATPIGMRNVGAAGGLIATAEDLVRWKHALASGKVVSDHSWLAMISPTVLADESSQPYGYGIALGDQHDQTCYSHGGGINGFGSILMSFPEHDLHIAVLANSDVVLTGRIALRIAAAAMGIEEESMEDLPVEQPLLDRIAGTYRLEQIGLDIRFWNVEDRLRAQAAGQPEIQLLHQGEGVFRATFDPSMRMIFPVAEDDAKFESFTLEQAGMTFEGRRVDADDADRAAASTDEAPAAQAMLDRITGTYRLDQVGLEIRFRAENGRLHMRAAGQPEVPLLHRGDGVFGASVDPSLRLSFPISEDEPDPLQTFTLEQRGMKFKARRLPVE